MRHIDGIKIDTDEGRYVLVIDDEQKGLITYDIHDHVLQFYAAVQTEIRPYVLEAESARETADRISEYLAPWRPSDKDTGYELDDPKHPTFFERMVD